MRSRASLPEGFAGNAWHVAHAPARPTTTGAASPDACSRLHSMAQAHRDQPAQLLDEWLSQQASLRAGVVPAARGDAGEAGCVLTTNDQSRLPALDATFNAGHVLRVIPGIGDSVHVVAAPGGVDAYLNLAGVAASLAPSWVNVAQSRAFAASLQS